MTDIHLSERLNDLVARMLNRNIRATFKHIAARCRREPGEGVSRDANVVDRFTRDTLESALCWRDVAARRSDRPYSARGA